MKNLLAILALAGSLNAASVLVTEHGKTYHAQKCMALARSTKTYSVSDDEAKQHGLKPCGICYRPTKAKADKSGWMKK